MPTRIEIGSDHEGISVEYYKTKRTLYFSGFYDSFVGIEGESMTLKEFFDKLGITQKDCEKAFGTTPKRILSPTKAFSSMT